MQYKITRTILIIVLVAVLLLNFIPIPTHANSSPHINNFNDVASGTSPLTVTLPIKTSGDTVVILVQAFDNSHSYTTLIVSSITDSISSIYNQQVGSFGIASGAANCGITNCVDSEIWTGTAGAATTITITINLNHTPFGQATAELMDITGVPTTIVNSAKFYCDPSASCAAAISPTDASTITTNSFTGTQILVAGSFFGRPISNPNTQYTAGTGFINGGLCGVNCTPPFSAFAEYSGNNSAVNPTNYPFHFDCTGNAGCPYNIATYNIVGAVFGPLFIPITTTTTTVIVTSLIVVSPQYNPPNSLSNVFSNVFGWAIYALAPTLIIVGSLLLLFMGMGIKDERTLSIIMIIGFFASFFLGFIDVYIPTFITIILLPVIITSKGGESGSPV